MNLNERVAELVARKQPFVIRGGGSKSVRDDSYYVLDTSAHTGIIQYEPNELVIRARAGTRITELNAALAAEGQILAFDPPDFDGEATLGGTISAARSGSRRPWYGAARDFVLGVGLITGEGKYLEFGGQVMKNVAGFDVSRLVTGARGTLGVVADVSLKVLPAPKKEVTVKQSSTPHDAHRLMLSISNRSTPVSGLAFVDGTLYARFSGSDAAVDAALSEFGGEVAADIIWKQFDHWRIPGVPPTKQLQRRSVPPATDELIAECVAFDWGGAQRWLVDAGIGNAVPDPVVARIHERLKNTFDPVGLINPGVVA